MAIKAPNTNLKQSHPSQGPSLILIALTVLFFMGSISSGVTQEYCRKPDPVIINGIRFDFVRIPAGTFNMGSNDRKEEQPVHPVFVDSFDLAVTEVTLNQFRAFVQATRYKTDAEIQGFSYACCWRPKLNITWLFPGFTQADNEPVVAISCNDAMAYCKWLSEQTGEHYRLPSEAEWEYVCKTGNQGITDFSPGSYSWYSENSGGHTHPVATKRCNKFGLYDMLGNAWEWTADVYHENYIGAPENAIPWMAEDDQNRAVTNPEYGRVLRGGSWGLSDAMHPVSYDLRITSRPVFGSNISCNNSGFRIARTIENKTNKTDISHSGSLDLSAEEIIYKLIEVPEGRFLMGSDSGEISAKPAHEVVIQHPFYIGKTEITVQQFRSFVTDSGYVTEAEVRGSCWDSDFRSHHPTSRISGMNWKNPGFPQSDTDPVTCVSWNDAMAFCKWLSGKTGFKIRLPSEAEWEYTCSFGQMDSDFVRFSETAWFYDNSGFKTHPVSQKAPNNLDISDLLGNVSEWTTDVWHNNYTDAPADGSPWLGLPTTARVIRGGSFERESGEMGIKARDWYNESEAVAGAGFRIAVSSR